MRILYLSLALLLFSSQVFAVQPGCQQLTRATITHSGCYYLNTDIKGTINILSDSVTLDLNDRSVIDPAPGTTNIGINLNEHNNLIIKNGYIKGFWFGLVGNHGRNILISHNTFLQTKYIAINISGRNITIRNNHITNPDFISRKLGRDFYLVGMNVRDDTGCVIMNNVVSASNIPDAPLNYRLEYVGLILLEPSRDCRIGGNVFYNFKQPLFRSITTWIAGGSHNQFTNNLMANFRNGLICRKGTCSESNNLNFAVAEKVDLDSTDPGPWEQVVLRGYQ